MVACYGKNLWMADVSSELRTHSRRKTLSIFNIKCYTIHGANPVYAFGVL